MQCIECPECDNWRVIDNAWSPAGWVQPPCYTCGAPGWLESLTTGEPIKFFERITISGNGRWLIEEKTNG